MKKNKYLLLFGQFINIFGTQIYNFAISFYLLKQTGSGMIFGLSLALGMLPQFLCSPFAGALADKVNRKKAMVITDFCSGICLLFVFFLNQITEFKIVYIYALMFALAVFNVFNSVSTQSAIPEIFEENDLPSFNSLSQSVSSLARITAPYLGGIIIIFMNIRYFLLFDAISFFMAAVLESNVVFRSDPTKQLRTFHIKEVKEDILEGFTYCKSNPMIYTILLFMICMNFLFQFGYTVPLPYLVTNVLRMNPLQFGIIQSMTSLGALCTSLCMSRLFRVEKSKQLLVFAITLMSVILFAYGLCAKFMLDVMYTVFYFKIISGLSFLFGGAIVASNIPIGVLLQIHAKDHARGRVMGISSMITSSIAPLGILFSGMLLDNKGIQIYQVFFFSGLILLLSVLIMSKTKSFLKEVKTEA